MRLAFALQMAARRLLRRLPIGVEDPTLDDRMRLLEQRLQAVERKVMVRSVPKARAPTKQEHLIIILHSRLDVEQVRALNRDVPWWEAVVSAAYDVDRAFRDSGGVRDREGNPMRVA